MNRLLFSSIVETTLYLFPNSGMQEISSKSISIPNFIPPGRKKLSPRWWEGMGVGGGCMLTSLLPPHLLQDNRVPAGQVASRCQRPSGGHIPGPSYSSVPSMPCGGAEAPLAKPGTTGEKGFPPPVGPQAPLSFLAWRKSLLFSHFLWRHSLPLSCCYRTLNIIRVSAFENLNISNKFPPSIYLALKHDRAHCMSGSVLGGPLPRRSSWCSHGDWWLAASRILLC